jgi:hypothetical protein
MVSPLGVKLDQDATGVASLQFASARESMHLLRPGHREQVAECRLYEHITSRAPAEALFVYASGALARKLLAMG